MSAAHTPGPWVIVPYGDGETLVIHYGQSQQRVCFLATPSSVTDDFPRIKANARLIAAAPALFEALEEARLALIAIADSAVEAGFDQLADIIDTQLCKANEALAAARGGAS